MHDTPLFQALTEQLAPASDPGDTDPCHGCTVHHLAFPARATSAMPPDRLLPAEIAALRQALTRCPILRRIGEVREA